MVKKITTSTGLEVVYENVGFDAKEFIQYQKESVDEQFDLNDSTWHFSDVDVDTVKYRGKIYQNYKIYYPNGTVVKLYRYNSFRRADIPQDEYLINKIDIYHTYGTNDPVGEISYILNYAYFNTPLAGINSGYNYDTIEVPAEDRDVHYNNLDATSLTNDDIYKQLRFGFRLKLSGITKSSLLTGTIPYYTFKYNTTPLPRRLSPQQDWYGYFNNQTSQGLNDGQATFYLGMPVHTVINGTSPVTYGVNKASDVNYMKAFSLQHDQ